MGVSTGGYSAEELTESGDEKLAFSGRTLPSELRQMSFLVKATTLWSSCKR